MEELRKFTNTELLLPDLSGPAPILNDPRFDPQSWSSKNRSGEAYRRALAHKASHDAIDVELAQIASVMEAEATPIELRESQARTYISKTMLKRQLAVDCNSEYGQHLKFKRYDKKLEGNEFHDQYRDSVSKRRKLVWGDVALNHNRELLIGVIKGVVTDEEGKKAKIRKAGLMAQRVRRLLFGGKDLSRDTEQFYFRKNLIVAYGAESSNGRELWDPISNSYFRSDVVTAAHIVPHALGYPMMAEMFGGGNDEAGFNMMWSMANGMLMSSNYERQFDRHEFCIVPVEKPDGTIALRVRVIDNDIRDTHTYRSGPQGNLTWGEMENEDLVFRTDHRPALRFLYFHYWCCVYRATTELWPGYEKIIESTKEHKMWATPGKYLRTAMLRNLTHVIGVDIDLPEEMFTDGDMDDADEVKGEIGEDTEKKFQRVFVSPQEWEESHQEGDDEDMDEGDV